MSTAQLKRICRVISGAGFPHSVQGISDEPVPFFKVGSLQHADTFGQLFQPKNTISPQTVKELGAELIPPQSILMAKIGASTLLQKVRQNRTNRCIDNNMMALVPTKNTRPRYLFYLMHAIDLRPHINPGAVPNLSISSFLNSRVPVLEGCQQQQIADYLDHETAEIDSFIVDQENLSKLLQERWQSFLVHAIQTGGQGAAQLCSTEVAEWPYAPHRWEKMRLKSTILDSQNGSWGSEPGVESVTRRCIRVADFDKNSGRTHGANKTERSYPLYQIKNLELQPGDLIIEKSGGGPTTPVGNTVLYDAPGGDMFSNFVARIRLRSDISSLFAVYLHRSLYLNQITQRSIKQTTGIQNLDAGSYFNETIFLPPLEEQKSIGRSIEENRIETEASLQVIEKAIDLAQERRAALITAAVTGQIDVTARNKPAAEQLEDDIAQGLHREYA